MVRRGKKKKTGNFLFFLARVTSLCIKHIESFCISELVWIKLSPFNYLTDLGRDRQTFEDRLASVQTAI